MHTIRNRKRIEALLTKEITFYHKHQYDADPPALRGLTDSENDELEALLSNPFEIWMRNDYHAYVRAATRCGCSIAVLPVFVPSHDLMFVA